VIVAVQRELLDRESPLEVSIGFELGYARAWAIFALCVLLDVLRFFERHHEILEPSG
jgi:hypothetical protein